MQALGGAGVYVGIFALAVVAASFCVLGRSSKRDTPSANAPGARKMQLRTPPSELRDFTADALRPYTGEGGRPIYVAADGIVFNMSSHEGGPGFYGPGGGYSGFAGRDATIGLATMETDPAKWAKRTIAELSYAERDTLDDWVKRFSVKYDIVGYLTDGARPRSVAGEQQAK